MSNTLATRLREERKKLKVTQQVIADRVFITRETWSRYESGKINPGSEVLVKLAKLGVDTQYILTGKKASESVEPSLSLSIAETSATYKTTLQLSKQELELIRYYRKVNTEGKQTIDSVAKTLATSKAK